MSTVTSLPSSPNNLMKMMSKKFKNTELHLYDMKHPDFIKAKKFHEGHEEKLKNLHVPFEDLPNFLKPCVNFFDNDVEE